MKLTNPGIIQESEKAFIDTINAELDWEAIEKMLLEKKCFTLQDKINYKNSDLVVYNDIIAYKFDFEIKISFSVIFNRQGEYLEILTMGDDFEKKDEDDLLRTEQGEKVAQMASNIANMISEINHKDE